MIEIVLWFVFLWLFCGCIAMWIADYRAWTTGRRLAEWTWRSFATMLLIVAFGPIGLYGLLRKGEHWSKRSG